MHDSHIKEFWRHSLQAQKGVLIMLGEAIFISFQSHRQWFDIFWQWYDILMKRKYDCFHKHVVSESCSPYKLDDPFGADLCFLYSDIRQILFFVTHCQDTNNSYREA